MSLRAFATIAFFFILESTNAQPNVRIYSNTIDSLITAVMRAEKIPGLSLAIVMHGEIKYIKGYGSRDVGKDQPIDGRTNFLTCSISKLFTATAVMQLVEAGKLDLSQKLTAYVPDFRMSDERYLDITLDMLITHTSGLPNIFQRHYIDPPNDSLALSYFAQALSRERLAFPPGVELSAKTYSNTGIDILGLVIERVTGMTYSRYVTDHVLKPVGMDSSSFFIQDINPERSAQPHVRNMLEGTHVSDYYPDIAQDKPCGNLNSNALDLSRWIIHTLAIWKKEPLANAVIKPETFEDMWTTHRSIPGKRTSIGLGWWVYDSERFGRYYFHVGNDPGFSATLNIYPAMDIGIVILTNAEYPKDIIWNKIPADILTVLTGK